MKLLTAIIASAIVLVPSVANAGPIKERTALATYCSYPGLMSNPDAERQCVMFAVEASYKGYSVDSIKAQADQITANALDIGVESVSAITDSNIRGYIRRNRR